MQYFGVPRCPYCKKRVNLIRTWSLKRQGEYQCPRCGGISNIFLSPLIYVFALLAVFSGGAVYFFHKFVLDDIGLFTCLQVVVPFGVFFLLSLFMVFLAKPVIKRVSREEKGRKRRGGGSMEDRRQEVSSATGRVYTDQGESLPPVDYRTGPEQKQRPAAPAPAAETPAPAVQRRQAAQRTAQQAAQAPSRAYEEKQAPPQVSSRQEAPAAPDRPVQRRQASPRPGGARQAPARPRPPVAERPGRAQESAAPQPARRPQEDAVPPREDRVTAPVSGTGELSSVSEDFFKKYDDPAYVERRLRELRNKDGE